MVKKNKKAAPTGVAHIQSTFNNTIVTITNTNGETISWASAGAIGFKEDFVLPKAYFYVYGPDAPGYKVADGGAAPDATNLEVSEVPWLQKYEIWNLFPKAVTLPEHGESAEPRKVAIAFAIDNFFPIGVRSYNQTGTVSANPLSKYTDIPTTAL